MLEDIQKITKGMILGNWLVLEVHPKGLYNCKCTLCENVRTSVRRAHFKKNVKCSCQRKYRWEPLKIGEVRGYLIILEFIKGSKEIPRKVKCSCICGKEIIRKSTDISRGIIRSCGCKKNELCEETSIRNYGKKHYLQTEKSQLERKESSQKKYGVDHPKKAREVQQKYEETCQKRYGCKNVSSAPLIKEKRRQTLIKRYGKDNYRKTKEYQTYLRRLFLQRYQVEHLNQRKEYRNKIKEWCEQNPDKIQSFTSRPEKALRDWIRQFYLEANKYRKNRKEVDIYIPEINIGIEYNGFPYHTDLFNTAKNYHLEKTTSCEKSGIRLIHIWSPEWENKELAVKSFLLSAIGKNQFKIGARKCNLTWSEDKKDLREVANFLEKYHIQGKTSGVKYAVKVIHENQLVAVATFGKHHRGSGEWVLSRFCTKMNYTIQGVLSRISKLASQQLQSDIISWADYRLSQGNGYLKAGWEKEKQLSIDYHYWHKKSNSIISKQSRQKKVVGTPKDTTEAEHAELDGLVKFYDCGKIRFKYKYLEKS